MKEVDSADLSTHSRPYTVGVSIAVLLIFVIAFFHLWKFAFKKIKKCLNPPQLESVITEIPPRDHGDRKLSTNCIQQLEMVVKYEEELPGFGTNLKSQRVNRYNKRAMSEYSGTKLKERKKSIKHKRNSVVQANFNDSSDQRLSAVGITFLAGYSHRHVNDG